MRFFIVAGDILISSEISLTPALFCTHTVHIVLYMYMLRKDVCLRERRGGMYGWMDEEWSGRGSKRENQCCVPFCCRRSKLYEIAGESWGLGDDITRQRMSVMASAAAWGLGQWEHMEEYTRSIPKGTMEGSLYQSLLFIHNRQFPRAQKVRPCSNMQLIVQRFSWWASRIHFQFQLEVPAFRELLLNFALELKKLCDE